MAIMTHLDEPVLRQYLKPFCLGTLRKARPIVSGYNNTLYDILTTRGHFVLRVLEDKSPTEARFEAALLGWLKNRRLAVPVMLPCGTQGNVVSLNSRQQLSVFCYMVGREVGVFEVTSSHVKQVGLFLANMHQAALGFGRTKRNRFDKSHVQRLLARCQDIDAADAQQRDLALLANKLQRYQPMANLPMGIVHGDLSLSNVRFLYGKLSGVMDFEFTCTAPLVYDIAVALCDWAFMHDVFVPERARAMLLGYQARRVLLPVEKAALYEMCQFVAVRQAVARFYRYETKRYAKPLGIYQDYRHFMKRLKTLQDLGPVLFGQVALGRALLA